MFENMTYENILERCLARVSSGVDKREGSVIYDAIAPAAAELAQLYIELSTIMDRAFPDTATGTDLTKKATERGVDRRPASPAVRKGVFTGSGGMPKAISVGTRFSGGSVNFAVTSEIAAGQYRLIAETPGAAGNAYFGTLFPIDFVEGLETATLADVLIYGEDEESDDDLRKRYYESLDSQAFGGNVADYKAHVDLMEGVGGCKVIPIWNGGGTVKVILVDSEWGVPTPDLINTVQTALDPTQNDGEGLGIAPIGHVVTVVPTGAVTVNVAFTLTFETGYTWNDVRDSVTAAIRGYLGELVSTWEDSDVLVVRITQIETKILNVQGVIDIAGTTIGGTTANMEIPSESIPVLGEVRNNGTP